MSIKNILKYFIVFIFFSIQLFCQSYEKYRLTDQYYIEDSLHVFWMNYPNPFAPPTMTGELSKAKYCGESTFYCDLADTVVIAYQNEADSTLYSAQVTTNNPPFFMYCTWIAGSRINRNELPKSYYHGKVKEKLRLVIQVNGKKKCYREVIIPNERYYWISE